MPFISINGGYMMNLIMIGIIILLAGYSVAVTIDYNKKDKQVHQVLDLCKNIQEQRDQLLESYEEIATKLDSIKDVEIVDYDYDPELELTDDLIEDFAGDEEIAKEYIEHVNWKNDNKKAHRDIITKAIEIAKAEGLINKHLTIELSDSNVNHCQTTGINGHIYNRIIRVSHRQDSDFNDFMEQYIRDIFNVVVNPMPSTFALFIFLHELGHYVDSTLDHEEGYEEMNQKIKNMIPTSVESEKEYRKWQLVYRRVPNEAFADKWAIDFMIKHFPEYIYSVNGVALEEAYC